MRMDHLLRDLQDELSERCQCYQGIFEKLHLSEYYLFSLVFGYFLGLSRFNGLFLMVTRSYEACMIK